MKKLYSNFLARNISRGIRFSVVSASLVVASYTNAQTYTFTPAGATGRFGPTQTQVTNAYNSTNLQGSVTASGGIQTVTLQAGWYTIEAFGAQGGGNSSYTGGLGARVRGDFTLTTTQTVNILVGQQGQILSVPYNAGGGGGSFVWIPGATQPLIAAGGGGGAGASYNGMNAVVTTSGTAGNTGSSGTPGTGGNGANPGGGGWLTPGGNFQGNGGCT